MFKEIAALKPPFLIKGNFNDAYLYQITLSYLRQSYTLVEVTPDNWVESRDFDPIYLYEPDKPRVYLFNSLLMADVDISSFKKKPVIILENFNINLHSGLPEVVIARITSSKKSLSFVKDYCKYCLKIDADISLETWQEIYRPTFSVLKDIEKTLYAYNEVTTTNFNKVSVTSPGSIQLVELLSRIFENSFEGSVRAMEVAWDADISLEYALNWFATKLEVYLDSYKKGSSVEDAMQAAGFTGNLKKLFKSISKHSIKETAESIWKSLSMCSRYSGKSKDILILLHLFNK